jgi:hypothetical protein
LLFRFGLEVVRLVETSEGDSSGNWQARKEKRFGEEVVGETDKAERSAWARKMPGQSAA